MAVRPEAEVDEVEAVGKLGRVARRRGVEVGLQHRHRPDALERRGGERGLDLGQVAVRVAVGRHALVDLEHRHLIAGERLRVEQLQHPPRRMAAAERERERASVGDRRRGGFGDQLGGAGGRRFRVVADLDREPGTSAQLGFSSWPPNCFRIAESTLFAKSSRSREAKRE